MSELAEDLRHWQREYIKTMHHLQGLLNKTIGIPNERRGQDDRGDTNRSR